MPHTYAKLEVSRSTFEEVERLLRAAGYAHVFHDDQEHGTVIDMHGIGLCTPDKSKAEFASTSDEPSTMPLKLRLCAAAIEAGLAKRTGPSHPQSGKFTPEFLASVAKHLTDAANALDSTSS